MPTGVLASRVCARKNPKFSPPPYTSKNIVDADDVVKKNKKMDFSIKVLSISDDSDFSINFFSSFFLAIFHLVLP
jgi:hypothetical protein